MGLKILHLPTSVGGNAWGLAQGERILGLDSKVLILAEDWLQYPYDICLYSQKSSNFEKLYKRIKAFFDVRKRYDVFHFNFGSSLIDFSSYGVHLLDLPFYKGKKIMTYNGCDARQKYLTIQRVPYSACHEEDCYQGSCNSGLRDVVRRRRIKKVSCYVDHIFAVNPDLLYFLPREKSSFLPYTIARWNDIKPEEYLIKDKLIVVHAPTNREAKGSKYIVRAMEKLQQKYKHIEFRIIERIPNEEALMIYQKAHLVIDQVLIGWYGGVGVEVMKMGKPLAVFIREEDLKFIPQEMARDLCHAIINVNPWNLEEVLGLYFENPNLLKQKSEAVLEYVYRWHDPRYVASITKSVYEKEF